MRKFARRRATWWFLGIAGSAGVLAALLAVFSRPSEPRRSEGVSSVMAQIGYQRSVVRPAIRSKSGEVRGCYLDHLEGNPDRSAGDLELSWNIEGNGKVASPRVVRSEFAGAALENCVVRTVGGWSFPSPPRRDRVQVSHTFSFKREAGT